jgi:hypothetical protein
MSKPPYKLIWSQLNAGKLIPFLGAGASLCCRPVTENGEDIRWTAGEDFLPSGSELADWLAKRCSFPELSDADLAKIASYFEIRARRRLLVEELRGIFGGDYSHGSIHDFLAAAPVPLLIVTTNYDDLIERAFRARKRPYHLVTCSDREEYAGSVLWWEPEAAAPKIRSPKELELSLGDTSIVYKMHGTVSAKHDSFVITEEDYVGFLARMTYSNAIPARFMLQFREASFLFLGYGLRDWNLRVMLESLRRGLRRMKVRPQTDEVPFPEAEAPLHEPAVDDEEYPSWAIQQHASELERELWWRRNVQIFDLGIDEFVTGMRNAREDRHDDTISSRRTISQAVPARAVVPVPGA